MLKVLGLLNRMGETLREYVKKRVEERDKDN